MVVPTLVMAALAAVLLLAALLRGQGEHREGLRAGLTMTAQVLPLLVLAFLVAGLVQAMLPREQIGRWVGAEAGWRGIFVGSLAGACAPGGPYVSLPIVAALLKAGAGAGTLVAFLTGWSVWAFSRLPMEVGVMGWRLTAIRLASTLVFPPVAGFIAHTFFGRVRL